MGMFVVIRVWRLSEPLTNTEPLTTITADKLLALPCHMASVDQRSPCST